MMGEKLLDRDLREVVIDNYRNYVRKKNLFSRNFIFYLGGEIIRE